MSQGKQLQNLKKLLAIEEAKAGLTPQIRWGAAAARKLQIRKPSNTQEEGGGSAELERLRGEMIKAKLFEKQAVRVAKKVKLFAVQKAARKLKEATGNQKDLEEKLCALKKLDHSALGKVLLVRVLKADDLVWSRVGPHTKSEAIKVEDKALDIMSVKKDEVTLLNEIRAFLSKLYHEDQKAEYKKKADQGECTDEEVHDGPQEQSFFVSALNQDEYSEEDGSDKDSATFLRKPVEKTPRKKKRPGQRARREMWEKQYGDKANHIRKAKAERRKEKEKKAKSTAVKPSRPLEETGKGLHPSWAAKLQQRQKLSAAPAERIVFD